MGKTRKIRANTTISLREQLCSSYSDLRVYQVDKVICIEGSLPVYAMGKILDRYLIRIEAQPSYPRELPTVYEAGGRIPKTIDRHFHKDTERACVCLKDEWGWISAKYPTLFDFIVGPVTHFFTWQACYEFYGTDKLGGWSHGPGGRLEFYKEKLQVSDVEIVKKCLVLLSQAKYNPNLICYCGSGSKICDCHKAQIINLRIKIPPKVAKEAYGEIWNLQQT